MRQLNSFFICVIFAFNLQAQSTFDKSLDASGINEVEIILDNFFLVEITNTTSNKIIFNSISEGEYKDHILIKAKRSQKSIFLQDDMQPFMNNHNDKLSAHKVFAAKAKIQIPRHLAVIIKSRTASVQIRGTFKNVFAELNSGDCSLQPFVGNAKIYTLQGNIVLYTKNADVKTVSSSGKIKKEDVVGQHQIELKSISGDISVYKTK